VPEGQPSTSPPTNHWFDRNRTDLTEARPDIAATPRRSEHAVARCYLSTGGYPPANPSVALRGALQLPVGPGAPCGVVGEVLFLSHRAAQEIFGRILTGFSTHRFVHISARVCPQDIPRRVHKTCAEPVGDGFGQGWLRLKEATISRSVSARPSHVAPSTDLPGSRSL
jgi:hypothetical protein